MLNHYLIVANGPFLARDIIFEACKNRILIALDGAANKLVALGIKPDVVLGDFDSITEAKTLFGIEKTFKTLDENAAPYSGKNGITIVPAKNQQLTDLQKAIHYCDQHHAATIHIICGTAGRLDHHESVVRTLRSAYKKEREMILHSEQQSLGFVKDESLSIHGKVGDICGVVAFPQAVMSSRGLLYEYQDQALIFGFAENTCNSLKEKEALITVSGEALVIMPPLLLSQRQFMAKSEVERLKLLLNDALTYQCHNTQNLPHEDA